MTEKFFEAHGVKKEPMKGGLACLLNFPIPAWAVKKKKDGTIEPKLWEGYTTALIQIKAYYEKLMNPSKDN